MVILLSKLLRDYKSSGGKFVGGEFSFKEKKCSKDTKEALLKPEECVYDAWATKPTLYNSIFSLSDILCNIKISPKPQRLNPIYEVTVYQPQNISIRNEPKLFRTCNFRREIRESHSFLDIKSVFPDYFYIFCKILRF